MTKRNQSETHIDIATVGVKKKKKVFYAKMQHVQSNALQEGVLMFKGKETLFTWILFHGNNF